MCCTMDGHYVVRGAAFRFHVNDKLGMSCELLC